MEEKKNVFQEIGEMLGKEYGLGELKSIKITKTQKEIIKQS